MVFSESAIMGCAARGEKNANGIAAQCIFKIFNQELICVEISCATLLLASWFQPCRW